MMPSGKIRVIEVHPIRLGSVLNARLPLRDLTVLVGRNGAGKSSLLHAMSRWRPIAAAILRQRPLLAPPLTNEWVSLAEVAPIANSDVYAYTTIPGYNWPELTLTAESSLSGLNPPRCGIEAKFPFGEHVKVKMWSHGMDPLSSLLRQMAHWRYLSTDRVMRWPTGDAQTSNDDSGTQAVLSALRRIPPDSKAKQVVVGLGRSLFDVDWDCLWRLPGPAKNPGSPS